LRKKGLKKKDKKKKKKDAITDTPIIFHSGAANDVEQMFGDSATPTDDSRGAG